MAHPDTQDDNRRNRDDRQRDDAAPKSPESPKSQESPEALRGRLAAVGQEHVLSFYADLGPREREQLLGDVRSLPLAGLPLLIEKYVTHYQAPPLPPASELMPVHPLARQPFAGTLDEAHRAGELGQELLSQGAVAALTVAGGQGTRLGFDGPKGAFPVGPVSGHPLFLLFAQMLRRARKRYGADLRWYIMTSPQNHRATQGLFAANDHYGLPADAVRFFPQGQLPSFSLDGKLLLAERHRLALSPDGHGGVLTALHGSGGLHELRQRGVQHITYFQVDNPLVRPFDPLFIGLHALHGAELSSKALRKAHALEPLGNFCLRDGKLAVIEYSDMPAELAQQRQADGSLRFGFGSISLFLFSRPFIERLVSGIGEAGDFLPLHRAVKKVPHVDLATGQVVQPAAPNAVKLERFVFDALPLARQTLLLETARAEEFSPVKNLSGVDSAATCRRDLIRRAAAWLEEIRIEVPRRADGEPDAVVELSPLLGDAPEDLRGSLPPGVLLEPGSYHYFSPGAK